MAESRHQKKTEPEDAKTPLFSLSCRQLQNAIADYKARVASGEYARADFWHFCGCIDQTQETIEAVIRDRTGPYAAQSALLRKFCVWLRGQYNTAPEWCGSNASKSVFVQKQNFDGLALCDRPADSGGGELLVRLVGPFGGLDDPFA